MPWLWAKQSFKEVMLPRKFLGCCQQVFDRISPQFWPAAGLADRSRRSLSRGVGIQPWVSSQVPNPLCFIIAAWRIVLHNIVFAVPVLGGFWGLKQLKIADAEENGTKYINEWGTIYYFIINIIVIMTATSLNTECIFRLKCLGVFVVLSGNFNNHLMSLKWFSRSNVFWA